MTNTHARPNQPLLANARMYSVSPVVTAAWRQLLEWVLQEAKLPWSVVDYPAPRPLMELWERNDLGCALMCGLVHALWFDHATPIVAPVVQGQRYGGLPVYFTDIVVHSSSPFKSLEGTFGTRVGYTIRESQSGYVGLREHLLPFRQLHGAPLFREVVGPLVSPRGIIDALLEDRIDVGPIDSYAHDLIRKHYPEIARQLRTIATTAPAPVPLFVATAPLEDSLVLRLREAFGQVTRVRALQPHLDTLLLSKFVTPNIEEYDTFHTRSAASNQYPDAW